MFVIGKEIKIGTQLAEADGFLFEVTEIIKKTQRMITVRISSDFSSTPSYWTTGNGIIKNLIKIDKFNKSYKESFDMENKNSIINKNSKVGDKVDFFGFEYTIIELSETIDPYAEYSKHFVAICYENGLQISGGIPECKNPYFDVNGVMSGKKISIYD